MSVHRTIGLCAVLLAAAVSIGEGRQARQSTDAALEVIPLRSNVFMIAGAGANITVQVGGDGAIVVDAGSADHVDQVIASIGRLSPKPIRYVIDTSADDDHVGGNERLAKAGQTLFNVGNAFATGMTNGGAAAILSAERVLLRMSAPTGENARFPSAAWPTETFAQPRKYMFLNDEGIEVLHQPAAHTDGDSIVFFRRSDIVSAGDIIDVRRFPVIDIARGGSVQGEIAALNRLVDLAIPSVPIVSREGGTLVVPGHGRIFDQTDVAEYRDMVTIVRDRVNAQIRQGKTLAQVKASSPAPTAGYTQRYGTDRGWTADMFVEAVYNSLTQTGAKR
jgi:glyoxylase-like metal-dependent hydrolase (beta-lactamase superfamily II)